MKAILLTTAVLFSILAGASAPCADDGKDAPALVARPDRIDYGQVLSGEIVTREIRLLNKKNRDITISRITFTCGCTIPEITLPSGRVIYPDKIVDGPLFLLEPGETATVRLAFQARTLAGPVARNVFVHSPDSGEPPLTIPLTAEVRPAFTIEPRQIDFGSLHWTGPVTHGVIVRSAGVGSFTIGEISGLPPFFSARARPLKDEPVPTWRLDVTLERAPPAGVQNFILHCKIKSRRIALLKLRGRAEIEPEVTFRAKPGNGVINFGVISAGAGASAEVDIVNINKEVPYKIDTVRIKSAFSEFLRVRLHTLEAGVHHKLFFTVDARLRTRFFRGTIVLTSCHPELASKEIPFKGWINLSGENKKEEAP